MALIQQPPLESSCCWNDPSKAVQYFFAWWWNVSSGAPMATVTTWKIITTRDWCHLTAPSGPKSSSRFPKNIWKHSNKNNPKKNMANIIQLSTVDGGILGETSGSIELSLLITCDRFLEHREPLYYCNLLYKSCKIVQIQRHTNTNWVSVLRTHATFLHANASEPRNG